MILLCAVLGLAGGSIWAAVAAGAGLGASSMVRLIAVKSKHPHVSHWKAAWFYGEGLALGLGAALAGFLVGAGVRGW